MASWMVHLRIADILMKEIPWLTAEEFIMGNIAPDSGVPTKDGTTYSPTKEVSHFQYIPCSDGKDIDLDGFITQYFTKEKQKNYNIQQKSFYFGYLCHLITDIDWLLYIWWPVIRQYSSLPKKEWLEKIHLVKKDWYDLDFLFLKKNPEFSALETFKNTVGFSNTFMPTFSENAFDERRKYIMEFYSQKQEDLERIYPYLTEERADLFIEETVLDIRNKSQRYLL